jgi:hypothetical protein
MHSTAVPMIALTILCAACLPAAADQQGNPLDGACSLFAFHDCEIETLPSPVYPSGTELGEADCSVTYRVREDWAVDVLDADCSDERFVDNTIQGMSTMRYETEDVCGRICPTIGETFEYPIQFRLE